MLKNVLNHNLTTTNPSEESPKTTQRQFDQSYSNRLPLVQRCNIWWLMMPSYMEWIHGAQSRALLLNCYYYSEWHFYFYSAYIVVVKDLFTTMHYLFSCSVSIVMWATCEAKRELNSIIGLSVIQMFMSKPIEWVGAVYKRLCVEHFVRWMWGTSIELKLGTWQLCLFVLDVSSLAWSFLAHSTMGS